VVIKGEIPESIHSKQILLRFCFCCVKESRGIFNTGTPHTWAASLQKQMFNYLQHYCKMALLCDTLPDCMCWDTGNHKTPILEMNSGMYVTHIPGSRAWWHSEHCLCYEVLVKVLVSSAPFIGSAVDSLLTDVFKTSSSKESLLIAKSLQLNFLAFASNDFIRT